MDGVEAAISSAVSEARESGVSGFEDTGDMGTTEVSTPQDTPVVDTTAAGITTATGDPAAQATTEPAIAAKPQEQQPPTVDDPDGLGPERDATGRVNRIPHTRVKEMVGKAKTRIAEEVADALGLDKAVVAAKPEALREHLTTIQQERTQAREQLELHAQLGTIMESDPARFMGMLAQLNPEYGKYLNGQVAKSEPQAATDPLAGMPEPDFELPNGGGKTYSIDGVRNLIKWVREDTLRAVKEENKTLLDQRLKPVDEAVAEQQRQQQLETQIGSLLDEAKAEWPGFADHSKEISIELSNVFKNSKPRNFRHALDMAYRNVVWGQVGKARSDRQTLRKEILAELQAAPTATAAATTAAAKSTGTGDAVYDAIASSVAAARARGEFS